MNYLIRDVNLKIKILILFFLDPQKKSYDSVSIYNVYNVLMKIHHIGINHFSYAFRKQKMVQVLAVNILVEFH